MMDRTQRKIVLSIDEGNRATKKEITTQPKQKRDAPNDDCFGLCTDNSSKPEIQMKVR